MHASIEIAINYFSFNMFAARYKKDSILSILVF